jgi:hypothetical protein
MPGGSWPAMDDIRRRAEARQAELLDLLKATLDAAADIARLHRISGADKDVERGNNIACQRIEAAILRLKAQLR